MAAPAPPTKDKLEQDLQNVLDHSIGLTAGAARANVSLWTVQKAINDDELPGLQARPRLANLADRPR